MIIIIFFFFFFQIPFSKLLLAFAATAFTAALAAQQLDSYVYSPKKLRDPMRAKGDDKDLVPQSEVEDDEEEYITDSLVAAASNSINAKLASPPDAKNEYRGPDLVAAGGE